jgi:TRAP-type C4-dicarboxylate transport system substrate-binding protein
MKKLVLILLMVVLTSALILVGCPKPATPEVFQLRFANAMPEMMKDILSGTFFCDYVVEHSGGRIEITKHYGGSLASGPELLDLAKTGGADIIGLTPVNLYKDTLPIISGVQFQYLKDMREILPFMNGLVLDNPEVAPLCEEELARQNLEWMTYWSTGHSVLCCNFLPAATLADLQGKKVGVASDMPFIDALGMSSVMGDPAETYESLSRGVFDAAYASASMVHTQMLFECSKAYVLDGVMGAAGGVAMNRDAFNSLPADLQQVCRDAAAATADHSIMVMEAGEVDAKQIFADNGCEVNIIPPADQLTVYTAVYNDWEIGFTELCGRTGVSPDDRDMIIGYVHDFAFSQ